MMPSTPPTVSMRPKWERMATVLKTIDFDGKERYYDLNGRQLNGAPKHGVYIHNGKKVVGY
ncbi:MAG: hypothetical protein PUD75_06860 [Prevotella sp.]|nr:hypothetical protein [Prevotella sp.]